MSGDREFAVLFPILNRLGEECVLLTKRTTRLVHYSGQVSFPGGAREEDDADLKDTALREAQEEIGLARSSVEIFEELRWFRTGLGHRVKPFVGRVQTPVDLTLNPAEVERLLYVPLAVVKSDPFSTRGELNDGRPIYTFDFEGDEVWGLTARILRHYFVDRGV